MKIIVNILFIIFIFISIGCVGSFEQTDYEFEIEGNDETLSESGKSDEIVPIDEEPIEVEEVEEEDLVGELIEEEFIEEEVPDPNERPAPGSVVVFEIPDGTGDQPWNSFETPVVAYVGQVLLIVNKDNETHQLHASGGSAINHGQAMAPGGAQEFELNTASPLRDKTPFYDHLDGGSAGFWLEIRE